MFVPHPQHMSDFVGDTPSTLTASGNLHDVKQKT